jgi:hypothetical protein
LQQLQQQLSGIFNGAVRLITITNRGDGYTTVPRVAISSAPSGGTTAVGVATLIGGLVDCVGESGKYKVQGIEVVNSGFGYTVAPSVVIVGGGGAGAAATATIADGVVGIITLTSGGSGYEVAPSVTFSAPTGSGVTANGRAYINSAGIVTTISIIDGGCGYTSEPTITLSSPYSSGIGTYIFNETVTGTISSTTAIVKNWNSVTNILQVSNLSGSFVNGDLIVGSESLASYKVRIIETDDINDPYAQNDEIESEADSIIDFSESNPFGNP